MRPSFSKSPCYHQEWAAGDWAGNETHFARELAEHALAHVIGDKAEQAYRRSDALEKRRSLRCLGGILRTAPCRGHQTENLAMKSVNGTGRCPIGIC
jgi:hypothetical protein